MHIFFLSPDKCDPPHDVTHPNKVEDLVHALWGHGWDGPPLLGYQSFENCGKMVVLLSGSHRYAAAKELGIKIPVEVIPQKTIQDAFGDLPKWQALMKPAVTVRHVYDKKILED